MTPFQNTEVQNKFDSYPKNVEVKLLVLRELIFDVVREESSIIGVEETLKWGEPS